MEPKTFPRLLAPPLTNTGEGATIQVMHAAMQRTWATGEPALLLVRTEQLDVQHQILEQLETKAIESGALRLTAEVNVVGLDGPYGPLLRALTAIAPEIEKDRSTLGVSIRHRLAQAAAPTGTLLRNFCPAFAPILNGLSEPETLSFGHARDRLETLLVRVFAALAPAQSPVVFFLRHAQQADVATLRSLSRILEHAETRQLAIVALVDPRDPPRHEAAWRSFIGGKKYVIERFDVGVTNSNPQDSAPCSGFFATQLEHGVHELLEALSCTGQTSELIEIATATQRPVQDVALQLTVAAQAGVVLVRGSTYGFVDPRNALVCQNGMHPRARGRMHLHLGKLLAFDDRSAIPEQAKFVAAAHFVAAVRDDGLSASTEGERKRLARQLFDAAQKAMAIAAHDVAEEYLEAAVQMLECGGTGSAMAAPELVNEIDFARLECACAMGNRSRAKQLFDVVRARVPNSPAIARAWCWLVEAETRAGEHHAAIALAAEGLAAHGIHVESSPTPEVIEHAMKSVWEALGDRAIEEIADLEPMTDHRALDATELLLTVHPSAQALGTGPADLVACHLSRLALLNGNADGSSVGHVALGAAVVGRYKDHRMGTRLGKVALLLSEQRGMQRHRVAVAMKFAAAMSIWTHPLQNSVDQCARTYEQAMACGDSRTATRLAAIIAFLTLLQGAVLDEAGEEALRRRRAIRSHGCDDEGMGDLCEAIDRFVGQQKGRTVQRRGRSGSWHGDLRLGHLACRVVDLMSLVLTHEYEAAAFLSMHLSQSMTTIGAQILIPEYWFWSMLAATATRSTGLPENFLVVVADFERWADRCPQTFQHKYALLVAERARLEGRDMDAMRAYDEAITEARENGFTHLEALAAELATRFYSTRDFPLIAGTYFQAARQGYGRWGASSKLFQLDRRFPKLSGATETAPNSAPSSARGSVDIDVFAAVKVAQTVAREIVLQRLLVTLMKITIEHAAAERCHVLLAQEDGTLQHAGKALSTSKGIEIEVPGPSGTLTGELLPASILEHVRSTHELVCLEEAIVDHTWADDPYITSNRPRSVVCCPIMRQTTFVGMFYLENNSGRGMFTPRRLALLGFLANQAAISLEHAKLYADLARENAERRRAEHVVRKSEERLRRLVEIADVIPWEVDADTGCFTFIGAQAENRFGWPVLAWSKPAFLRDHVHPDERDDMLAAFTRACTDGKHAGIDFRLLAENGAAVWLHMVIGSVEQENGQRILSGFFFDITERREAEQILRDKLDIIARQKDNIRALSTPLLDVADGIVAMPILGELDEDRASRIMDVLLETITRRNIRAAILDLTGVTSIQQATAEHIGRIVRAVELVGARTIVAGIRADVARAIISLDGGLGRIETRARMKDALSILMQPPSTSRIAQKNQSRPSR